MAKFTARDLTSLVADSSATTKLNENFADIETALENTLSRDGSAPNTMGATFDMNSHKIVNLPAAATDTEPVRLREFNEAVLNDGILASIEPLVLKMGTIADLKAISSVYNNTLVEVASYYSTNSRGGGLFRLLGVTADVPDDFLIVQDNLGRNWQRLIPSSGVDAHMAGAKADCIVDGSGNVTSGTDDTAAINKVLDYLRDSSVTNLDFQPIVRASIGEGTFLVSSSLDATSIRSFGWVLDFTGSVIVVSSDNKIGLDLTDSRRGKLLNLHLYGAADNVPVVGLKIGRKQFARTANDIFLDSPVIRGQFTKAAWLNVATEGLTSISANIVNDYNGGGTFYAYWADGFNQAQYDTPLVYTTDFTIATGNPATVTTVTALATLGWDSTTKVAFSDTGGILDNAGAYTITPTGANTFTIPVNLAVPVVTGYMYEQRFASMYVSETLPPWSENSFKENTHIRPQFFCQHGKAAMRTSSFENHKYIGGHYVCGTTTNPPPSGQALGMHMVLGGSAKNNKGIFDFHHEKGTGDFVSNWAFIQGFDALKAGTGTDDIELTSVFFTEESANSYYGFLDLDTGTVNSVTMAGGLIEASTLTNDFGNGVVTDKLLLNHTLWNIHCDLACPQEDAISTNLGAISGNWFHKTSGVYKNHLWTPTLRGVDLTAAAYEFNGLSLSERSTIIDEFNGKLLNTYQWDPLQSGTASLPVILTATNVNGRLRLATGTSSGDKSQITTSKNFRATQGGIIFECRVVTDSIADVAYFIGLTDETAIEFPIEGAAANTLVSNATDAFGVLFDTTMSVTPHLWGVGVKNNVDATKLDFGSAQVAGTFDIFRIEVSALGDATFYRNDTLIGSVLNAVTGGTLLTPTAIAMSRSTNVKNIDVDYIFCQSVRG